LIPGGPHILVVDDDPLVKEPLSAMIEGEGWSFYGADTVEEAVAAVNDIAPEVIVLEPRTDGGRAAGLLVDVRQAGSWIPVVLHTGDPAIDEAWALEHGASGLLRKPGGTGELRDRINELLKGRKVDRPR
jgi:two-component system nitrogen regulation response regulator NtrX